MSVRILLGLVIGCIIGILFTKLSHKPITKGPNSSHIRRHVFHDQIHNKYYKFEPVTHVCPPSIDVTEYEHSESE